MHFFCIFIPEEKWETEMAEPRVLDVEIIDSWYTASNQRDPEWWSEMQHLLTKELRGIDPIRCWRLNRDLKWLRHEAWKRNYPWGRERRRWAWASKLRGKTWEAIR